MRLLTAWLNDVKFHYNTGNLNGAILLKASVNASLRACVLFRLASGPNKALRVIGRAALLRKYSCDVGPGALIDGPIDLPHPVGIVIGSGVRIGSRVRIFQHVTLGKSKVGAYPVIEDDVTIFTKATVVGGVIVGRGATVGAHALVTRSVPAGTVVRAPC